MRVVLASDNGGKLAELTELLGPMGFDLVPQGQLGITPRPETASTFIENALEKARFASRQSDLPAIGDDSGLVVRALDGQPGIRSARYAGEEADTDKNVAKLLAELDGVQDRSAHFYCALVFMRHALDPAPLLASGTWHGSILTGPQGSGGFGYDPVFHVDPLGRSAAQLTREQKNRFSHRGRALRTLCEALRSTP